MPVNRIKTAKAVGIGTAVSLAVILLTLCVIGGVLMMTSIPTDSLSYIVLTAIAVGTFLGGYVAAAVTRSKGLIVGLLCSAAVFVILSLIGLCSGRSPVGVMALIRLTVSALFGALGGIKGVNRKEKLHIK